METSRPPPLILAAAALAFVLAAGDIVDVVLDVLAGSAGAVVGTLVRDALLVVAGVMMLRRATWAYWTLVVLFALGLLRLFSADEWHEYAFVGAAAAGLALLLHPAAREWIAARPGAPAA